MENEIKISELYQNFSMNFPEAADFWNQMSREEEEHSNWIREAMEMFKRGQIKRGTTTLTSQAIDIAMKHVDSLGEKCRRGEISMLGAYANAYDLENSLLEKKFFSVFALDLPAQKEIGDKLLRATQAHRERLGEALSRIKARKKVPAVPA